GREQVATALGARSTTPLIPQRALAGDGPWILARDAVRVARHLGVRCVRVGERWSPQLGVKTGADDVFLSAQPGPATRPAVRGRDVGPWRVTPRVHLLWTHAPDGRPLAHLPPALAAAVSAASTPAWCARSRSRPPVRRCGAPSPSRDGAANPTTTSSRTYTSSTPRTAVRWQPPRILSDHLAPLPEPLACLLTPGAIDAPAAVAAQIGRAHV